MEDEFIKHVKELKKVLPTKAQLAKCVADSERQVKTVSMGLERRQCWQLIRPSALDAS